MKGLSVIKKDGMHLARSPHQYGKYVEHDGVESVASKKIQSINSFDYLAKRSGRYLMVGDILSMLISFVLGGFGAWIFNVWFLDGTFQNLVNMVSFKKFIAFSSIGAFILLWLDSKGQYKQRIPYWESVGSLFTASLVGFLVSGFSEFASKSDYSRLWLGLSWLFFFLNVITIRGIIRRTLERLGLWTINAIIIGDGDVGDMAIKAMNKEKEMGFKFIVRLPSDSLGHMSALNAWKKLLLSYNASHIFLALEAKEMDAYKNSLRAMVRERIPYSVIPAWAGLPTNTMSMHNFLLSDVLLVHDTNRLKLLLPRVIKRAFDFVASTMAIIALLPIFTLIAIAIRMDGGPAFFSQPRAGMNGKTFRCLKFRSMRVDAEEYLKKYLQENPEAAAEWSQYQKLKSDVRITRIGHFIRKTSIDELPQLFNVLKGDMSLVGPRPIMIGQEYFYEDDYAFYESVRPGITGPWQVSGRNALTFKERAALEINYARNWNLWTDIIIILKTLPALLSKDQAF